MIRGHGQPRLRGGGEAAVRRVRFPRHGRAATIATLVLRPELDAIRIDQILEGELGFRQAELLALIEADRAAQREKDADGELGQTIGRKRGGPRPARDVALDVVV